MTLILETSSDKAPLEALRDICQRNPNSKLFMPLAEQLRRRGCYGEAIDICRRAKAVHPQYVSCRVLLGRCLIELGMKEEAREELEDVLKLDRENVFSLRVMAEILRAQGELREAVDYYRALVRINPGDMDARRRLVELMQLPETYQDRQPTPSRLDSRNAEGASSPRPPKKEEYPTVGDPSDLSLPTNENSEAPLRGSRELLKRELERSDFSRFAEWVSANCQDYSVSQGKRYLGGQD